jgi:hypothetical protein
MQKLKTKPRMTIQQRIEKGDDRIAKLYIKLTGRYGSIPNGMIYARYGWGTGVDILVTDGKNKILELREVTNFDRFDQNGNPIYICAGRKDDLIESLTRKLYWKYYGKSKKRFYPDSNTKRYLDISYESNLSPKFWGEFRNNGIIPEVWNRTEYPKGFTVEDGKGNKTYFLDNGQQVRSIKQII